MSLDEYLNNIRAGIREVPPEGRDRDWAHRRCTESRKLHEAIWECRPKREYVFKHVIPLLEDVQRAVQAISVNGGYRRQVKGFARNVGLRVKNLRRYAEGKCSRFAPSAVLKKVAESKLEPEDLLKEMQR